MSVPLKNNLSTGAEAGTVALSLRKKKLKYWLKLVNVQLLLYMVAPCNAGILWLIFVVGPDLRLFDHCYRQSKKSHLQISS